MEKTDHSRDTLAANSRRRDDGSLHPVIGGKIPADRPACAGSRGRHPNCPPRCIYSLSWTCQRQADGLCGDLHACNGVGVIMAVYEGKRTIDGLLVTADGKKLDEHYEIKRFTRFGFEWTYEGDSPQQLALAILFDRLGNKERAIQLSEPFMKTVIANLDNDWKLTSEEIDAFVRGNPQAE